MLSRYLLILSIAVATFASPLKASTTEEVSKRRIQQVICTVFGNYCSQALRVSYCESRFNPYASNGQYLGLFQMGSWERRTFGHGSSIWIQARAAYRYFAQSGYDWSPWSCKP